MPLSYRVDHVRRIVIVVAHGSLTSDEMIRYQKKVWSSPEVAGYAELVDMTEVEVIGGASGKQMEALAQLSASMDVPTKTAKFAIVAPQDEIYGLGRMYEAYRESTSGTKRVAVFRNQEDALAWLEEKPTDP